MMKIILCSFCISLSLSALADVKKCNLRIINQNATEELLHDNRCIVALECYEKKKVEVEKKWFPQLDTEIYQYHNEVRERCGVVFQDPRGKNKHVNDSSLPKEISESKSAPVRKTSGSRQ